MVDEEEEQAEKPWTLYNPGYFSNSDFRLRIVLRFGECKRSRDMAFVRRGVRSMMKVSKNAGRK